MRIILKRTRIGQSTSSVRPQTPPEFLPPPSAPVKGQVTTPAAQNVTLVHHQQPLHPSGNAESGNLENFPVLSPPTNRVEGALDQSRLPYWLNEECHDGSYVRRNSQVNELVNSLKRMNTYMRGLQDKVRRLEEEKKQFQIQLSRSNAENENLKNDAAKMERELRQRDQSESLFLKLRETVDNLKEEFQQLNSKVENAVEKISGAMKDCRGFKDLDNKMEELRRKLEQIEEKMEQRGEHPKSSRVVFKGVVTTEDSEESSSEYQECCPF